MCVCVLGGGVMVLSSGIGDCLVSDRDLQEVVHEFVSFLDRNFKVCEAFGG